MTARRVTVGAFVDSGTADIQTGPFGTQLRASDYVHEGTPVINVRNIGHGNVRPEKLEFVTEETTDRLASHVLAIDDIVFGRKGAVDRHLFVGPDQAGWMQGSDCIRLRFFSKEVVPRFVSYACLSPNHQAWMLTQAGNKATMASLNHDIIKRITFALPPVAEQQKIVEILATYDDLIENNQRRMILFEDTARQLYQEWFVRLRFPGHEHTRIVSGLPDGWAHRTLGSCSRFSSGGTPSKARADFWEGHIPWVSSGELTALRIDDASLHVTEEAAEAGSRLVPANTILVVVRGMSLAKEFRLAMTSSTVCFNQDLKAVVPDADVEPNFLFHCLVAQRDTIRDRCGEAAHGTKKLDTPVLASTPVLLPSHTLQQSFSDFVSPMNSQWDNLNRQTTRLRAARDLLLSRFTSGEPIG